MDREIKGAAELQRFLRELPVDVEKNLTRGALRAGGKVFEREVKAEIPVKDGELRASARVTTGAKKDGRVYAHVKVGGGGKGDPYYARFVHEGTRPHDIKPSTKAALFVAGLFRQLVRHPGAQPNPFMRRAFNNKADAAIAAITGYLRAGIERMRAR